MKENDAVVAGTVLAAIE
ncbi:MAG: hypothetical protein M3Y07_07695 [Acidobacteriota bacterium]|nr:hypothetical protein [Acidobacteriota bacterium]